MSETADYANQQVFIMLILTLLGLLVQIGFLIVAITNVRRASPEASGWLTTSAVVAIASTVLHPAANAAVSLLVRGGTMDTLQTITIVNVVFSLVGLANACCQLMGIVRLAESRRRE